MLTTRQVAEQLGITVRRVQALIRSGRLKAFKHGRDWLIIPEALTTVQKRQAGRPKKGTTHE